MDASQPASNAPYLSVIVPVRNGAPGVVRCLRALNASTFTDWEGIVVDDGSTDGSGGLARHAGFKVVMPPRGPGGPARARNLGAKAARGQVLVFVDADIVVPPHALGLVAQRFRSDPECAACFGSYDETPADPGFLSQYKNLFHHYVHQHAREEATTFWSGFGAIRRDVFMALGGFDTRYTRPTIEDIELGYRLHKAGHKAWLDKRLQATHLKRWTAWGLLRTEVFDRGVPWTRLILRAGDFPNDLNLQVSARVSVLAAYGMLLGLVAGIVWPEAWALAALFLVLVLALNVPLYRFFARKRGLAFALEAIPWHWLYLYYSGLSFAIGVMQHLADLLLRRQRPLTEPRPVAPLPKDVPR